MRTKTIISLILALFLFLAPPTGHSQSGSSFKTPLSLDILNILANEISGQMIFNNEVILAGAPWIRNTAEFANTFYESEKIVDIAKSYGIETIRIDQFKRDGEFSYAFEGEFWIVKPETKLIARLEADAALVASGSSSVDITGDLIYIPPLQGNEIKALEEAGEQEKYKGKIALMWSHARGGLAKALDAAGVKGVISFRAQDRYLDPDQVIYSGGSYSGMNNLEFGFTISWRQWSQLLEDVEKGRKITARGKTRIEQFPNKIENVFAWIPGTEPDKKGIIFSGHLYEGYTKRGANDNMSGVVVQLEILRTLSKLIENGTLPKPRRTIYFLWPNEISGTYEHFTQHPGFTEKISTNINMDMVGEGLRKNNAILTVSESPNHLPSYLDGLSESICNYVWRMNDIVYLPDSPNNRFGQIFPSPIWEKNGSRDAFRYDIQPPSGGSDHVCFNSPSIAVPGLGFCAWPDQWYHADADTPDKSDPTQLKRMAFIGAGMAWATANCTDEVLEILLDEVSDFGYERVARQELSQAMKLITHAEAKTLQESTLKALNLISFACNRESEAVQTTKDIFTGSEKAEHLVDSHLQQWTRYETALRDQLMEYSRSLAPKLGAKIPGEPEITKLDNSYNKVIPALLPEVKGQKFNPNQTEEYNKFMEDNPDFNKELMVDRGQQRSILNYINGRRSVTTIRNCVVAESGKELDFENLLKYLNFLKTIKWITY
ncbi:MAG: M28 family peptidase [Candidatus Aminicenantes bacterium]|nr:M28 family peptidase [Candidatus Aminicenantes bacterium]